LRTLVAHTPVSRLGNIFSTKVLPFKSSNDNVAKSDFTRLNEGAGLPVSGRLPFNDTGCFLKFTFLITILLIKQIIIIYIFTKQFTLE
jgi:hypothetical protein